MGSRNGMVRPENVCVFTHCSLQGRRRRSRIAERPRAADFPKGKSLCPSIFPLTLLCARSCEIASCNFRYEIETQVHDAGHMVPMDQPKAALEMLRTWMNGKLAMDETEERISPE